MAKARVEMYNGSPAIIIDGQVYPPQVKGMALDGVETMESMYGDGGNMLNCMKDFYDAGFRIFNIPAVTEWLRPWALERFCVDMERFTKAFPDAYYFVRISLAPPVQWVEEHPDDVVRYSDGKPRPAVLTDEYCIGETYPAMYSMCSDAWREDGGKALVDFCKKLDATPYGERVIGFFLCAGGTSEWYYPGSNRPEYRKEGVWADFSPSFRKNFSLFLKEKYGTQEALRIAWNDPEADIDNPAIPDLQRRRYVKVTDDILYAMRNLEQTYLGIEVTMNPQYEYNVGAFSGGNNVQTTDFYYAWNWGNAKSVEYFAKVLKEYNRDRLVMVFYGSLGCTDYMASGTTAARAILDCEYLDLLAAPGVYTNRQPGGCNGQREVQDSIRMRNKIFMCEDDSRVHLNIDLYRDSMEYYTVEDSIATLKREFGRNICEDIYGYWDILWTTQGRELGPEIMQLFAYQQKIAQFAYRLDRTRHNEIALIFDEDSLFSVSQSQSKLVLDHYRCTELPRIGAPVDYYFHDDLMDERVPDYKLYVCLNTYVLTDEEREMIHRKAAKNHATVLWLYAPGFLNPKQEDSLVNENITKTTGFKIGRIDDTLFPRFRVNAGHPAVKYCKPRKKYGYLDREVVDNIWIGRRQDPPFVNPFFYIDDPEAEELGRFLIRDEVAMGLKEYKGFISVYCATQVIRAELLASIAEYAGCHLYQHADDVLYANESFVTIHAKDDGVKKLYFKKSCSPYEIYEKKYYGHEITELEVEMEEGETLMFFVGDCKEVENI